MKKMNKKGKCVDNPHTLAMH